jgi:hypothetical protein
VLLLLLLLLLLLQAFSDPSRAAMMRGQRTLEINPDHPLIVGLKDKVGRRPCCIVIHSSLDDCMALSELCDLLLSQL